MNRYRLTRCNIDENSVVRRATKTVLTLWFSLAACSGLAHGDVVLETGFEGQTSLPADWSQTQSSGAATWTIQTGGQTGDSFPSTAHSGSNNATLYLNDRGENKTRLITPTFDTVGYTTVTLSFYHAQPFWSPDQDEFKVFFSDDAGASWTELAHYTNDIPDWTQQTLNLPSISANSRIAFEGNAKYGHGVSLDDIVVTGSPSTKSTFSVSATDANASEVGPDPGIWTITRTGKISEALTLNYTLSGTATLGSDYTVDTPSPINFAAEQTTAIVTLLPVDDNVGAEGVEVATLTLTEDTEYFINEPSAGISIYDDDPADMNILVIGSTNSYSFRERWFPDVSDEKPFNPSGIGLHLQSILAQDPANSETVQVFFEDIYKSKQYDTSIGGSGTIWDLTYHCYSLIQHFMWPEGKDTRRANLRGEGDQAWDYIILCGDPYVMANFPGIYAEGVKAIQNEVAQSANPAQIILLGQWPENSSTFSAADFNEVIYRVGDSAALPVAPAGKAWDSFSAQDTNAAHPTPKGEYLAAAAIYSRIFDRNASSSAYNYDDTIADHAFGVIQASDGVAQYTGAYTTENAFQMKYYRGRQVDWNEYGTSTEEGFANGLNAALAQARVGSVRRNPPATGNPVDLSYSRGNDTFEPEKQYQVNADKHDRVHGFPVGDHRNTGPITMRYGIDKRYYSNDNSFVNGTDLGIAYSMVREDEIPLDVRGVPVRLLWSKINHFQPTINSHRDGWHLSNELDRAVGAYMFTLLTGRCPVEAEPADEATTEWKQWFCRKIGYETAWQMAHLTTRAPGFRVLPSSTSATTVTPTSTETMTVHFVNPPQADVTVTISTSNTAAAIAGPKTLVFTPSNYNTPQQVTVAGIPGASGSEAFDVVFSTSSDDEVYDALSDAWGYTNNRSSTVAVTQVDNGTSQVVTAQYNAVDISLNVTGASASNTVLAGPSHGSIIWNGTEDIQYTPSSDYLGTDQIVYAVTIDGTQTIGCLDITVQLPDGQVSATASDAEASEEGPDSGTFVISRFGDTTETLNVFFSLSGTADPEADYTLSHTSPVTIPAGQDSIILTLTPVDDAVFGERDETTILSITEDAAYPIGIASATITIADNDNNAPDVDAGADQSVALIGSAPWSPAEANTALWLDANDASTITLNAGGVEEWRDKSGNSRNASQATTGNQPTHLSAGLNGNGALSFDGSTDYLDLGTGLDFLAGNSHSAYIVVADMTNYSNLYGAANGNSGSSSLHVGFANSNTYRMNYWSHDYGPSVTANFQANGSVLNYVWEVGAPKQILANGKSEATGHNAQAIGAMAGGGRIGNIVGQGFIGGKIAEMVFLTGTVAQANRERMEGYLAHKWGLEGNLSLDHPYKASAPGGASVTVDLNGTITDADGETPIVTWTKLSGPGLVGFATPAAADTTATFSLAGTYVLRLTADDGYAETFDEVTITVAEPQTFADWISGYDLGGQIAPENDSDGDGIPNAVENYFGTNPGAFSAGLSNFEVTTGGIRTFTFSHPINGNPASDLSAKYLWSKDLATFYDSGASDPDGTTVTFSQEPPSGGMVHVTATVTGTANDKFFTRVQVTTTN